MSHGQNIPKWYYEMWKSRYTDDYQRGLRRWAKDRPEELAALHDNLDDYKHALDAGTNPLQVRFGFLHNEGCGVVAIDQKGPSRRKKSQARLYVYPEVTAQELYHLLIGDKRQQSKDVVACHRMVRAIRKERGNENQQEEFRQHQRAT